MSHDMLCIFSHSLTGDAEAGSQANNSKGVVDFTPWVNDSPLAVSPRQPIEIVHQMFKTMG